jgi:hypothetical protein
LTFHFLSIGPEISRSVTNNVSKRKRFTVHLNNKIFAVIQMQKSIIFPYV